MPVKDLLPVLQVAIGPVILVSGVGLLLLTMTNRFGRIIDRARRLAEEMHSGMGQRQALALAQLRILLTRARIVRMALALASTSALLAAVLIMAIFLAALLQAALGALIVGLFIACLLSLALALGYFLRDINLSLKALRLEVGFTEDP